MIALDLDGTLLRPDHSIGPRTRAALLAAQRSGILVVPATGRSQYGLRPFLPREFTRLVVCSNGAVTVDLYTGEVFAERTMIPAVQTAFIKEFGRGAPGTRFAALRDAGLGFAAGPGYVATADPGDHGRDWADVKEVPIVQLTSEPAVKLIARHPDMGGEELLDLCDTMDLVGVTWTISGVPFLEVSAAGVTKEWALAVIAEERGIEPAEVMAFGDSLNDRGMLAWAGHGVAMGNARDDVREAADEVTGTNAEEGIADVVERLL